jgi:predicted SprT family Zn-dependent metalloprotease
MLPFTSQRTQEVIQLATDLFAAHGLHDWSFGLNRRKRSLGMCFYGRRVIELSIYLVENNDASEVRDTLLHEIAHALVGPEHAHDAVWQQKCCEIGARPERCGQAWMPPGRWQAVCSSCGQRFHRHRRPRRLRGWHCRACGLPAGKLVWRRR